MKFRFFIDQRVSLSYTEGANPIRKKRAVLVIAPHETHEIAQVRTVESMISHAKTGRKRHMRV